jgi:hypothetical protein
MTQNLEAIRRFILGGMAIFTIVSKKSGERKTFKIRKAEDVDGSGRPHGYYVDLLIGPSNTEDYRYMCYMWEGTGPVHRGTLLTKLNAHGWASDSFTAFRWLITAINHRDIVRTQLNFEQLAEFHHAGICSRCGRTLTDPESIELGIGPVCRGRAA